jgi:hypothetical protein
MGAGMGIRRFLDSIAVNNDNDRLDLRLVKSTASQSYTYP